MTTDATMQHNYPYKWILITWERFNYVNEFLLDAITNSWFIYSHCSVQFNIIQLRVILNYVNQEYNNHNICPNVYCSVM